MKCYLLACLSCFLVIHTIQAMDVEADQVTYGKDSILLEGNVCLTTDQLMIKAHRAQVNTCDEDASMRYYIFGDVVTTVGDKWKLHSDTMTINEQAKQIHAVAENGKQVKLLCNKGQKMDLQSEQLTLHWIDQDSEFIIRQLTATKDVKVYLPDQNMKIISDRVVYREKDAAFQEPRISFYREGTTCRMEVAPFLSIDSTKIVYFPNRKKTYFSEAIGILSLDQQALQPTFWEFSSNKMVWDQQTMALQLKGDVIAHNPEGYRLQTEKATIYGKECDQNFFCHLFSCPDVTKLAIDDHISGPKVLISPGGAQLDFIAGRGFLNTKLQDPGNPEEQCYYSSEGECFFSDHVNLQFNPKSTQLTHILAEGNTYLRHYDHNNQTHLVADTIDYDVKKDTMFIQSHEERPVLYYDQSSNIAMSAPSVSFEQNNLSGPEIKGNGDVKMILSKESSSFWKQTISKYQNIHSE